MTSTTECHFDPMRIIDGPKPDSPAGIVYRAAKTLRTNATDAVHTEGRNEWRVSYTKGSRTQVVVDDTDEPTVVIESFAARYEAVNAHIAAIGSPELGQLLADAWDHQADDMGDNGAHFHPVPIGWTVVDEYGRDRSDWTATVRAALKYLSETAPEVA